MPDAGSFSSEPLRVAVRVAEPLARLAAAGLLDLPTAAAAAVGNMARPMDEGDAAALAAALPPVPPPGFVGRILDGVLCGDVAIGARDQGVWLSCRPDAFDLHTPGAVPLALVAGAIGRPLASVVLIPPLVEGAYIVAAAAERRGGVSGVTVTAWTCASTVVEA